ncbi:MAG: PriCT-2 domain-containing protein [Rhodoferax sp.]|nr:PriCT-2 domain-containing protein [Rhodoferax sp.]
MSTQTIPHAPGVSTPDIAAAKQFLNLLDPTAEFITWQYFSDDKSSPAAGNFSCTLDDALERFEDLQSKGCGIFYMVNAGDGKGRSAVNVVRLRAIWVDWDAKPGEPTPPSVWPIEPSIVIESSPGKFHYLWLLRQDNDLSTAEHKAIEVYLRKFGNDKSANDACRVLRLPGLYHLKDPNNPFMTRIVSMAGYKYTGDEVRDAFPPVAQVKILHDDPLLDSKPEHLRGATGPDIGPEYAPTTRDDVAAMLKHVPLDESYGGWLNIGMALHSWDEDAGLELWHDWSRQYGDKYNKQEIDEKWRTFKAKPGGVTIATIARIARDNGYTSPTPRAQAADGVQGDPGDPAALDITALIDSFGPINGDPVAVMQRLSQISKMHLPELALEHIAGAVRAENKSMTKAAILKALRPKSRRPAAPASQSELSYDVPQSPAVFCRNAGMTIAGEFPLTVLSNAVGAIQAVTRPNAEIWRDAMTTEIRTSAFGDVRTWSDRETLAVQVFLQSACGLMVGRDTVRDAVEHVADNNTRNELTSWLDDLTWDGVPRLDTMLHHGFGAEVSPYSAAVGSNLITAMVARAYRPGCKFDICVVFEGQEGTFKSSSLQALAGREWFAEMQGDPTGKDFFDALLGKWLVEIDELDRYTAKHMATLKGGLSRGTDHYRRAYRRDPKGYPRTAVIVATSNRTDWLVDEGEHRRFWPVPVTKANPQWIAEQRDQLFAEGKARFQDGVPFWEVPDTVRELRADRCTADPWIEIVEDWMEQVLSNKVARTGAFAASIPRGHYQKVEAQDAFTTCEVLSDALGIFPADQNPSNAKRVAHVLRGLGYERKSIRVGDEVKKGWARKPRERAVDKTGEKDGGA